MGFKLPLFGDIAKSAKDLQSKEFTSETKFESKLTTADKVTFTTTVNKANANGAVSGSVAAKFKHDDTGITFNAKLAGQTGSLEATHDSLVDGLKMVLNVDSKGSAKITSEFVHEYFTVKGQVNPLNPTDGDTTLEFSAGAEGVVVGANVLAGSDSVSPGVITAGYVHDDFNVHASYYVSKAKGGKAGDIALVVAHSCTKDTTWGAEFAFNGDISNYRGALAVQTKHTADTSFKAKISHAGVVSIAAITALTPSSKVTLAGEVDVKNSTQKAGLSLILSN
eukprot:GFYU01000263.1.p1 GENE.GFYU01000263.1~~GFYU01000263.1.p1  ORF type:complete len:280 (+),score=120.12 GFYU01000263.1:30-869(+)